LRDANGAAKCATSSSYDGITRIRFNGFNLSLAKQSTPFINITNVIYIFVLAIIFIETIKNVFARV
jgi:hypothetical protein